MSSWSLIQKQTSKLCIMVYWTKKLLTNLELVDLALQFADVVVFLFESSFELHHFRLEGLDARLALLQLRLQLRHQITKIFVVVRPFHLPTFKQLVTSDRVIQHLFPSPSSFLSLFLSPFLPPNSSLSISGTSQQSQTCHCLRRSLQEYNHSPPQKKEKKKRDEKKKKSPKRENQRERKRERTRTAGINQLNTKSQFNKNPLLHVIIFQWLISDY